MKPKKQTKPKKESLPSICFDFGRKIEDAGYIGNMSDSILEKCDMDIRFSLLYAVDDVLSLNTTIEADMFEKVAPRHGR